MRKIGLTLLGVVAVAAVSFFYALNCIGDFIKKRFFSGQR